MGCYLRKVELWLGTFYDGAMESAELRDGMLMGVRYCYEESEDPPPRGWRWTGCYGYVLGAFSPPPLEGGGGMG